MSPPKKSVLITGCSTGGIGAGLATAFQKKNYHVFATVRNPSKAPPHLSSAPNVTILTLDVLSPSSIAAAVASVTKETGGRLDVLVNNSGQNLVMPALDTSIEDGRKLFDLNFFAPLAVLQAFAPLLVEARGCVVNQSSAAGYLPMPFLSPSALFPFLSSTNLVSIG
jgi:1-acylglycerone phosphate reductase